MLQTYWLAVQSLTLTIEALFGYIMYVYWADEGVRYTYLTNVYVIVYNSAIHQECEAAPALPNRTLQHVQGFTFGWLTLPVCVFRLEVKTSPANSNSDSSLFMQYVVLRIKSLKWDYMMRFLLYVWIHVLYSSSFTNKWEQNKQHFQNVDRVCGYLKIIHYGALHPHVGTYIYMDIIFYTISYRFTFQKSLSNRRWASAVKRLMFLIDCSASLSKLVLS